MKKIVVFLLGCLLPFPLWATPAVVKASFAGNVPFTTVAVHVLNNSGKMELVNTIPVQPDNTFDLHFDIPRGAYFDLVMGGGGVQRELIIVVNPNDSMQLSIGLDYEGVFLEKVTGSRDNEMFRSCQSLKAKTLASLHSVETRFNASTDDAERLRLQQQYRDIDAAYARQLTSQLEANSDLLATAFIALQDLGKLSDTYKSLFQRIYGNLSAEYADNPVMREIYKLLTNPIVVGKMAPDITLNNPRGNPVKLSSLRGKWVLVDFWASWCGPCRRENPNVVAAYRKYHDKGFEIFSVSLDTDPVAWQTAIDQDDLLWPSHGSSLQAWSCPVAREWHVNSIPFCALLNPEGRIVATHLRGESLDQTLESVLGKQ